MTTVPRFTLATTIAKDIHAEFDGYAYINNNVLPTFKLLRTRTIYLTVETRGFIGVSTKQYSSGFEYSFYKNNLPLDTIEKELGVSGFITARLDETRLAVTLPKLANEYFNINKSGGLEFVNY